VTAATEWCETSPHCLYL